MRGAIGGAASVSERMRTVGEWCVGSRSREVTRKGERFGRLRGVRCVFASVRESGKMWEEDADRGIDGRCG